MIAAIRKLFTSPVSKRSLEAASGGRRWREDRSNGGDAAKWAHAGASTVAARAAHYVANTGHGARAAEVLASNLIGTGIKPRSQAGNETARKTLNERFARWAEVADASGRTDFFGLQAEAARDLVIAGEALFGLSADPVTGAPLLNRLHPEQLDRSVNRELPGGGVIVQGVELNRLGRVVAYWIRPYVPGAALAGLPLTAERFPATEVLHVFRRLAPGQVRGLSWFAPVLLSARDLDALSDAMLVRAKVSSLFVGSIVDIDGNGPDMGAETATGFDATIEPGAIRIEQPGKRLEWSEPPTAGDAPALARETLRAIAAGLNLTYEALSGDYSQSTYSSARAALLEFRRFCEGVQHGTIIPQFCRPVWRRFVQSNVLTGRLSATGYRSDPAAFEACKWLPPAWPWVDPEKDAKAAIAEIEAGLASRAEKVAERGYDIEEIDTELAADRARAERLGLNIGGSTNAV